MYDSIAKKYIESRDDWIADALLLEMSTRINRGVNPLSTQEQVEDHTNWLLRHTTHHDLGDGVVVHSINVPGRTNYITTHNGNVVHTSMFETTKIGGLNFPVQKQSIVGQTQSAPPGIARRVMFHHLESNNVPIISDSEQTDLGHNMWRKLVPEALDRGYHVSLVDGNKITKVDIASNDFVLNHYFGDSVNHIKRHLVVSKDSLDGSN